ncbi:MAG: tRNA (guanosine(37)-N1)-methyltransferase TrmD [Rhodospirillaceae bacterium]|nr:tRNA (guanosine(37)-N1)-methyltransferase TrmD [Rhodospirillaceae bacterium]MBT4488734.1 tRNA (guanosine(37)-N1)-methyltransferase TrmD [Rhodospirillaceae bacterium]MBT5194313.1 tRNA (guanosine(37)-N1)-methyltransferase TrmD [Rhodospirillaceae bacterium]MBT5897767.1 tRNA (guanosine(37)-N1)-methyltransferase TrmD [Rhodospirillaceae bacterium]
MPGTNEEKTWVATVLTLFPEMFPGPLGQSLAGKALKNGIWRLETVDIRNFARDKHRSVDDAPFGGGPGMVMRPDILADAVDHVSAGATVAGATVAGTTVAGTTGTDATNNRVIYLSPRGRRLDQALARELSEQDGLVLVCGRFEGVDQRALEGRGIEEVSIGDYVLSGGETAALVLLDAVVRLLPGVIGDSAALEEESFAHGLLEYPQYTRPQIWEGREVPEVLTSGHHEKIKAWRLERAEELTRARRPDLWDRYLRSRKS